MISKLGADTLHSMQTRNVGGEEFAKIATQVVHDIRSPLAVIRTFLLHLEDVIVNPDHVKFRELAVRACARIEAMAGNLLEYRRNTGIQCRWINLAKIVSAICEELQSLEGPQQVMVVYEGPKDLLFYGDGQQLERIVQNLVHNAIQALQNTYDGCVWVCLSQELTGVQLIIRDNGPGISQKYMGRLFEGQWTTKKGGNGLGLLYCAQAVKAHGGSIRARNLEKRGTEFSITLPNTPEGNN